MAERARASARDDVSHGAGAFLNDVRSQISDSAEFRSLAGALYSGVRDNLREVGQPSFGKLSQAEQEALVNRVRRGLAGRLSRIRVLLILVFKHE